MTRTSGSWAKSTPSSHCAHERNTHMFMAHIYMIHMYMTRMYMAREVHICNFTNERFVNEVNTLVALGYSRSQFDDVYTTREVRKRRSTLSSVYNKKKGQGRIGPTNKRFVDGVNTLVILGSRMKHICAYVRSGSWKR